MGYTPDASYGRAVLNAVASQIPVMGRVLVVFDPDDASKEAYGRMTDVMKTDTDGKVHFFTDFATAYAAANSNNNDVIVLDAQSTHLVTDMVTFSKNRVHVMGFDGGDRLVQQGAKLELTGNVAVAAVMKCTGVRNSFRNIKFIQSSTNAAALNVVQFAGEGNLYENCSFIFGVANNLGDTGAAEALVGEDSGTFIKCSFGTDVLLNTAARNIMALDAISGASSADGAKSNRFVDCEWLVMSSSASAVLLKVIDTAGAKFLNHFINPVFIAVKSTGGGGIAITNAVQSVASFVDGSICLTRPATHNCTNGCDTLTANVTIAGAPVFSSNAWEGGTPA